MSRKTLLKHFQQDLVASAVRVLSNCLEMLSQSKGSKLEKQNRQVSIAKLGHVLIEAPTGIGKTLMAGETVERLSLNHKIIWFWFAPFSGVVDQSIRTLQEEFGNLSAKSPSRDRFPENLNSGDVFVTTWSSLAVANASSRKARLSTETMVSIDGLIEAARAKGYAIGVVIDEAHHGFRSQTQAYKFYREVIAPELTVLVTATPKDKDVDEFEKINNIELIRLSVSRTQGVEAGLLKRGVKVGVFRTDQGFEEFINLQKTALNYGATTHRKLKARLQSDDIDLTPLMLVQVDAGKNAVQDAQVELKKLGFTDSQIRIHTADEPDPELLNIANDESVEVLVFKMAVAMGFDAPRAFTLVSLRSTVDRDWGVQIVGRIMRVHRKLQMYPNLPSELEYGYVFMSDHDRQKGLTEAAGRINSIKDELADVTQNVMVVDIGNLGVSVQHTVTGQTTLLPVVQTEPQTGVGYTPPEVKGLTERTNLHDFRVTGELPLELTMRQMGITESNQPQSNLSSDNSAEVTPPPESMVYPLRPDLGIPAQFIVAITDPSQDKILDEVIAQLDLPKLISYTLRENAEVHVEKTEVFDGKSDDPETIMEKLEDDSITRNAQRTLNLADRDGYLDPRDFMNKLSNELKKEYRRSGFQQANDETAVRKGAERLVALYPKSIKKAIKQAINKNVITQDAKPLPEYIESDIALQASRKNIYAVYPTDLNSWEVAFSRELDRDEDDLVLWWHRNPERKQWSVRIPVPGFDNYYPDFVVGIRDRNKNDGVLLIETKERINDADGLGQAKTQVKHPVYGKPMMLYWKDKKDWMIIEYDEGKEQNIIDRVFRSSLMKTY